MSDTVRSKAALIALLADNTEGDITAQTIRDLVVTMFTFGSANVLKDLATMQGISAPADGSCVWVLEVGAPFKFTAASTSTIDGVTSLGANDNTPGRWDVVGDMLSISPLGGTSDDWPRLVTIVNAAAAKGIGVRLLGGPTPWLCKSAWTPKMVSGARIFGTPSTRIIMSLATSGGPNVAAFMSEYNGAFTHQTTLTATANRGAFSIVTASSGVLTIGDIIRISNPTTSGNTAGFRVSTHTVVAVAGVNVNLDRPLPRTYLSGADVRRIGTEATAATSLPQDIVIDGCGMTVTGSGVRVCEITGARRCAVKNIKVDDSAGSIPNDLLFSFDVGSYDCHYENIRVRVTTGAVNPVNGIAIESGDGCTGTRCRVDGFLSVGFEMYDCSDCTWTACVATNCHPFAVSCGFAMATDTAVHSSITEGCVDCELYSCVALNGTNGFQVRDGSLGTKFFGCVAEGNTTDGFFIGDTDGTAPDGTQLVGCAARHNGTSGLHVGANALRTKVRGFDFSNNGTSPSAGTGIIAQGSLDLEEASSSGGNGAQLITASGGVVRIARLTAVHTQVVNVILFSGTSRASIVDSDIACAAGSNGITSGDMTYVQGVKVTGATNGLQVSGNVLTIGPNCDLAGCTTPLLVSAGTAVVDQSAPPLSKTLTTADATLTFAEAQSRTILTNGALTANHVVVVPNIAGMWWYFFNGNSGAFTTTIKTPSGTGIAPAQGKGAWVRCDGTNIVRMSGDI